MVNLLHSRAVAEIATWHDAMAVSYTRTFLHYVYSDGSLANNATTGRAYRRIMLGAEQLRAHPSILFHSSLAWLLSLQSFAPFKTSAKTRQLTCWWTWQRLAWRATAVMILTATATMTQFKSMN